MDKLYPENIYLQWGDPDDEFGVTWCIDKINDDDIIVYVDGGSFLNLKGKKRFLEYIDITFSF